MAKRRIPYAKINHFRSRLHCGKIVPSLGRFHWIESIFSAVTADRLFELAGESQALTLCDMKHLS
jgi:hypothetical protein